jgi:uncharacterized protein
MAGGVKGMRLRILIFLFALILPQTVFAGVIKYTVFLGVNVGVNEGCDTTALDPAVPVDAGAFPVGTVALPGFCLFNTSANPVSVTAVTVTGTDFSSTGDVLPFILQPNSANVFITGAHFTPTAGVTRTGQITFVSTASDSPQTFSLTAIGITDFGISIANTLATTTTVTAGQAAHYQLEVFRATNPPSPTTFTGTITVDCSAMPTGAVCSVNPQSFSVSNPSGPDLFVTVATTGATAALRHNHPRYWWVLAVVLGLAGISWRKGQKLLLLATLIFASFLISCGGGTGSGGGGPTPAGTYSFPVTATSNGISHSRNLTLIVK